MRSTYFVSFVVLLASCWLLPASAGAVGITFVQGEVTADANNVAIPVPIAGIPSADSVVEEEETASRVALTEYDLSATGLGASFFLINTDSDSSGTFSVEFVLDAAVDYEITGTGHAFLWDDDLVSFTAGLLDVTNNQVLFGQASTVEGNINTFFVGSPLIGRGRPTSSRAA
ncbi:MAG: hypothetical protein ACQGVK_04090 [Myxococcota bacterium]